MFPKLFKLLTENTTLREEQFSRDVKQAVNEHAKATSRLSDMLTETQEIHCGGIAK